MNFRTKSKPRNLVVATIVLVSTPLLFWLSVVAIFGADTNVLDWADEKSQVTKDFRKFSDQFDVPDFAIVTWPTVRWDDPSMKRFAEFLRESDREKLFKTIDDSVSSVDQLANSSDQISRRMAGYRLLGSMISRDGKQGCVAVTLTEKGQVNHPSVMQAIRTTATRAGVDQDKLRIGGVTAELAWIEREGIYAPLRLTPLATFICFLVCSITLRSFRFGILLTGLSCLSAMSVLALMVITRIPMDAVNSTLPTLGLLLTASLGLHWQGYFQDARTQDTGAAARHATHMSTTPAVLSIMTTCLGMMSLTLSNTPAIRTFGCFGAASTITAGVWALAVLPNLVELLQMSPGRPAHHSRRKWLLGWRAILRYRTTIIVGCVCFLMVTTWGMNFITTTVRLDGLFRGDHLAVTDARWIEKNLAPLSRMEIVLSISRDDIPDDEQRLFDGMLLLQDAESRLQEGERDSVAFSAFRLSPAIPAYGRGLRSVFKRVVYRDTLTQQAGRLEELGLLHRDEYGDHWRISYHTSTLTDGRSLSQAALANKLAAHCEKLKAVNETPVGVLVTGVGLLLEEIEHQFFRDLLITYVAAIVFVFLAVWIGFRDLRVACIAMIPNVFPPLVVLGMMGWIGVSLDVGSVMTASIALGIAVDDTIHLLVNVRRRVHTGQSVNSAVRYSFLYSGPAVLRTSMLGAAGLIVLGFSNFLPTARFGSLMAFMLMAAVIGDLIMLPALITTRLGVFVFKRNSGVEAPSESTP